MDTGHKASDSQHIQPRGSEYAGRTQNVRMAEPPLVRSGGAPSPVFQTCASQENEGQAWRQSPRP